MRNRRLRLSLLGQFSLLSLVLIVGAGAHARARARGADRAPRARERRAARADHRAGGRRAPARLARPDARRCRRCGSRRSTPTCASPGSRTAGLQRVKIFNSQAELVYSDDRRLIGRRERGSDNLSEALGGGLASDVEHGTDETGSGRQVLEIYTPLRLGPGPGVDGALEIYLSYDAVAAATAREKRTLYLFLGIGLALLYAVQFRIVARASRRLRHLALHDALTGLPNRTLFHERVERAIKGGRPGRSVAVLLVDLDRFKEVNDTLGHDHGDELLQVVAERLGDALREGDTLARLGGDEFAVVLADLPNRGAAAETAGRLRRRCAARSPCAGSPSSSTPASASRSRPSTAPTSTTLIQRADVAMYDAKRSRAPRRDLLDRARPVLAGAAQPPRRAAARDRGRRARPALPAEGVARGRPRHGRRGARALAAPRARAAAARRVRAARRADRHDRAAHALGARRRAAPVRRVAARVPGPQRRGQPRRGERARRRPAGARRRAARRARPARRARSSARSPSTP